MPEEVKEITTKEEIAKEVESGKYVIVDFYADWCGPCRAMKPKFKKMKEHYTCAIFLKVNVDDCEDLAEEFNIDSLPSILIFKDDASTSVSAVVGANEAKLKEELTKFFPTFPPFNS